MIDFLNTKSIVTPRGEVAVIARGDEILWRKQTNPYKVELAYLESTGTQWIDSGVECTGDLIVSFQGACLTNANKGCCGGVNLSNGTKYFRHHWSPANSKFCYWMQNSSSNSPPFTRSWSAGGVYITYINPTNGTAMVNDTQYKFTPVSSSLTTGENYFIFARKASDGGVQSRPSRFYNFRMERSGEIIRDFIPVLDWNDVPCMYDKVSGEMFYNAGTGEFLYGEVAV